MKENFHFMIAATAKESNVRKSFFIFKIHYLIFDQKYCRKIEKHVCEKKVS